MSRLLTLAELEAFDPHSAMRGEERRFLCPLCGHEKPRDAAHRCLCANTRSGLWNCWRCGAKGLLGEFREESTHLSTQMRHEKRSRALRRAFSLSGERDAAPASRASAWLPGPLSDIPDSDTETSGEAWRVLYASSLPLRGTAGADYAARRGIAVEVAERGGVRFLGSWHGRAALLFPFCNMANEVVAVAGRCLTSGGLDKPAAGPKKLGAFFAPTERYGPLDAALPSIILCEAPFDALSLAASGFPALALGGTASPQWLARACAFRRVALALDADEAGESAASRLSTQLGDFGATCQRLRVPEGKDWNEYLQKYGCAQISDVLATQLL